MTTTVKDVLGALPWQGTDGLVINSETRPAARTWLSRMGWPAKAVILMPLERIVSVYSDATAYLDEARQYGSKVSSMTPDAIQHASSSYEPRNETLLAYLAKRDGTPMPAPMFPRPEPEPETPKPETPRGDNGGNGGLRIPTPPKAKTDDAASELAALIQRLAGDKPAQLDEARVISLIEKHAPAGPVSRIVIETKTPAEPRELDNEPRHAVFPRVLRQIAAGNNVMLVGPAGAGKTHIGSQVAKALGIAWRFTGAIDSPYKLLGFTDAQGRAVRTQYRETYEHGGLFMLDEIDASAAGAILPMNSGLANGHQDFPDAIVERHASASFIASANTYGRGQDRLYVGRNQLDAASLDRFVTITMDYDEDLERAIYGATPWVKRVQAVRAAVARLNVRHVVSMRAIEQGTKSLAAGESQEDTESACLWKGLDAATVAKINAEAR